MCQGANQLKKGLLINIMSNNKRKVERLLNIAVGLKVVTLFDHGLMEREREKLPTKHLSSKKRFISGTWLQNLLLRHYETLSNQKLISNMVMTRTGRDSVHNAPKKSYLTHSDSDEDACKQIHPLKKPESSKKRKQGNKEE
ncbi:hypothetical protein LIER_04500 [Lithospermum erythrorhizon]|uniref:Uncharacterized protein n=1 Tax=Lithospermum erythrorhizon TaxID=34254 RepID=A0AAV3NZP9_LITER